MPRHRNLTTILAITLFLLAAAVPQAQVVPGSEQPGTDVAGPAAEMAPKPRVVEIPAPPTSATLRLLEEVQKRHGNLKTLAAEFRQKKTSVAFDETIESHGKVYLQMPDRLRCDYFNPDPSTVWFVDDVSYQVAPKIKQVDKVTYKTKDEAQAQFRLMLLGFGMSTGELLKTYAVSSKEEKTPSGKTEKTLIFKPLDPDLADVYKEFRVSLDEQLMPARVRYEEVSGDVTVLTITKIIKDDPIKEKYFKPNFPKDYEVIEH